MYPPRPPAAPAQRLTSPTFLLSLAALLFATRAGAETYISITGNVVTPTTGTMLAIPFSVTNASTFNARTWAFGGGTNAYGDTVAPGGIDSILSLYTASLTPVASNDDINAPANQRDSAITVPGATGSYQLFLSTFSGLGGPAVGDGHFAVDVRNTATTTLGLVQPTSVTLKTFSVGGNVVPGSPQNASLIATLTSPLAASSAVTFAGGAFVEIKANLTTSALTVGTPLNRFGTGDAHVAHSAGAATVNTLNLYGYTNSSAIYDLSGAATLNVFTETLNDNTGFVQSGTTTHTVTGKLTVGDPNGFPGSGAFFNFSGAAASLSASAIVVNPNATFSTSGGAISGGLLINDGTLLINATSVDIPLRLQDGSTNRILSSTFAKPITLNGARIQGQLNGGTQATLGAASGIIGHGHVEPSVTNNGDTRATNGDLLLDGPFVTNYGTLRNDPGANLFVTGTFGNYGDLVVSAGGGIYSQTTAVQIQSNKTLSLGGGTFAAPALTNNASGTITGFGNLSTNLSNAGTVTFVGPTNVVGNLTNQPGATITVRNDQTLITGLTTNNGTITSTSGGKIVFEGGLAPAPPIPAPTPDSPLPAGGLDGGGALTIDPASQATASYVRQNQLTLNGSTTAAPALLLLRKKSDGGETSVVNALTLTGAYRLDLADGAMIVNYTGSSPLAQIQAAVLAGFTAGPGPHWAGTGIASSAAAADPENRAVGYAEAADVLGPGGGSFAGQTADATSLLLRVTLPGDATLDGVVDFNDLVKLAQNYNATGNRRWFEADFNYDASVDFNDLVLLAQHYNTSLPADPIPGAPDSFTPDLARAFATVPEPATLAPFTLPLFLRRPRRRIA